MRLFANLPSTLPETRPANARFREALRYGAERGGRRDVPERLIFPLTAQRVMRHENLTPIGDEK